MTDVFIKGVNLETAILHGRTPCKNKSRDWGDTSKTQEILKIASKPQEAGENQETQIISHCPQKEPTLLTP